MRSVLDIGKDIVLELRRTGKPELLKKLFKLRTQDWKYHFMCVECGTIGTFSDLSKMSSIDGFNLISTSVEIVLEQEDADLFTTALSLLSECVHISKTTEIPKALSEKFDEIRNKVNGFGNSDALLYWNSILSWYRITKYQ